MRLLFLLTISVLLAKPTFAQNLSASVDQVISAEHKFVKLVKEKGIKRGFLSVSDENTIIFRPGPVKAVGFFKEKDEQPGLLSWEPTYARISKSGDWGYTSGPFTFRQNDTSDIAGYGDYFSVWKKNKKGDWKLAVDIGISHKKPMGDREIMFDNPLNTDYVRLKKQASYDQREDIVFSGDKLFGTILKADGKIARKEFLADNTRLLYPGYEPIIGKAAVSRFWEAQKVKIFSQPIQVDRAVSGELAFTYGSLSSQQNGKEKKYSYVRIWELQPNFKWAVLVEVLTPGGS